MLTNKCSILKRIYAFLIDLCLIVITSLIFEYACCIPFFNSAFHLEEKSNQVIVEQVKTGLYFFVDNEYNVISSKENTEEEIISSYKKSYTLVDLKSLVDNSSKYDSEFYLTGLNYFYSIYDENILNEMKSQSELFTNDNFNENVKEEDRIAFCNQVYNKVNKDINNYKDGLISSLLFELSSLRILLFALSYLIPILIFLFVIPLCNKNRASLGQKFLKLAVVDKYYVPSGVLFMLLRALAIYIFEVVCGFFTFGLTALISFLMMLILHNGKCLHDVLSFSQVIDTTLFTPFKNINEYKEFIEKEKLNTDKSLRKPYEE